MYWNERIQIVYTTLNEKGHAQNIEQMIAEYGVGGTIGEQFSIVCTWLAKLRNHESEIYALIKDDADYILQVGIETKYFTESYYGKQ